MLFIGNVDTAFLVGWKYANDVSKLGVCCRGGSWGLPRMIYLKYLAPHGRFNAYTHTEFRVSVFFVVCVYPDMESRI